MIKCQLLTTERRKKRTVCHEIVTTMQRMELNDLQAASDGPLSAPSLCFLGTAGLHEQAAGWVRREHQGAVSGINSNLCSQENADGLSTAGECLEEWEKKGDRACGGADRGHCAEAANSH